MIQETRPNKRLFHVTDAALAELEHFAADVSKPSSIRDDLLVKVQAADHIDTTPVVLQLRERASAAEARIELLGKVLHRLRGDATEQEYLRTGDRIGPYLTCLRGLSFERSHRDWCLHTAGVLDERRTSRAER